jgi:hypothetical protein
MRIRIRPDERGGIPGLHRTGEEQAVGQQGSRLLAGLRFECHADDRPLVFDDSDSAGQMRPAPRRANPAAVGPASAIASSWLCVTWMNVMPSSRRERSSS